MKKFTLKAIISALLCFFFAAPPLSYAEEEKLGTIRFGMSTALSGPSQYLGLSIYRGMNTYFQEVNQGGSDGKAGLLGRQIELIVMDDSYDPSAAVSNIEYLIQQHHVLAIVGNVGTPTFQKIWEDYYMNTAVTEDQKVAIYGAFSGAAQLRTVDKSNYIFNYRASYVQEMSVIVKHIVQYSGISPNQIAFLLQGEQQTVPDAYGSAGFKAAEKVLKIAPYYFEGSSRLTQAIYIRNQLETKNAIEKILTLQRNQETPEAIIIVGSYQASANFIQFMHRLLPTTKFYNLSFAGAGELAKALNKSKIQDRVYMTQVVEMTQDATMPDDLVEREGYLAAKEFVSAIRSCLDDSSGATVTPVSVKDALGAYFQYGDNCLTANPETAAMGSENQLSQYVELSRLYNGNWVHVNEQ